MRALRMTASHMPSPISSPTRSSLRRREAGGAMAIENQVAGADQAVGTFTVVEAADLPAAPTAASAELVFYTHVCCPYAERVWLTLLEKGLDFTLVNIDLSDKPRWYRSINKRMLVPAVQTASGEVHLESADICCWLAAEFRERGQDLLPASSSERAEMDRLISAGSNAVYAGLDLVAGSGRSWGISGGQTAAQQAAFQQRVAPLEAALAQRGGPYLLGQQLTLADVLVYPFMRRFDQALQVVGQQQLTGALAAWLVAMHDRSAGKIVAGDEERWLAALRQHKSLDWFDYSTVQADECHPGLS